MLVSRNAAFMQFVSRYGFDPGNFETAESGELRRGCLAFHDLHGHQHHTAISFGSHLEMLARVLLAQRELAAGADGLEHDRSFHAFMPHDMASMGVTSKSCQGRGPATPLRVVLRAAVDPICRLV